MPLHLERRAVGIASTDRLVDATVLVGDPGVGKTAAAQALAAALDTPLLRLQCYEGLTSAEALYEWNYPRQLLAIRLAEARGADVSEADLFSEGFLLERPLLRAISAPTRTVLLVDEVDKADEELEAFLLEVLAEYQVTVPELGTLRARERPTVSTPVTWEEVDSRDQERLTFTSAQVLERVAEYTGPTLCEQVDAVTL